MLRLFGAQSTAVGKTVENFPPQWRAAAQWKSRGAETLVALQAQSHSGLKKAAQALRQAFSADLYGAGETTLSAAVVEALERHDKLLICADAAAGALLEARLENLPGAEKVFDFGAVSYANPKTGPLIEKRARARLPKDCTDPLRQALARAQAARRVVGADLSAACAERESDLFCILQCPRGQHLDRAGNASDIGAICVDVVGTGGKVACTGLVLGGAGHSVDLRCVVHTGSLVEVGVGNVHLDIAGGQAVFLFHLFRSEGRDCHSAYQHSGRKCTCKYFFQSHGNTPLSQF